MPKGKKRRRSVLGRLQSLKKSATGQAWAALHIAEGRVARSEGLVRQAATGRPRKAKKKGVKKP